MTSEQRNDVLNLRKVQQLPWHSPPHRDSERKLFHISAACYEHLNYIGFSKTRIISFEKELIERISGSNSLLFSWCVLPNHYHILVRTDNILLLLKELGKLHGLKSYQWNKEENSRGRQAWHNCMERSIKGDAHKFATINYIHNNPVHHKYVEKWQDWPFSSAIKFIEQIGRTNAEKIWREYPVKDYGKGWDDENF
jgi:putative transposase